MFNADCDIELDSAVDSLKAEMERILDLIDKCDESSSSEYYTRDLKYDIEHFLYRH